MQISDVNGENPEETEWERCGRFFQVKFAWSQHWGDFVVANKQNSVDFGANFSTIYLHKKDHEPER